MASAASPSRTTQAKTPFNWKEQPCHFTWMWKAGVVIDFKRVINVIDRDLQEKPNLLRVEGLLFMSYLEVCDECGQWNVKKARKFLNEADECIAKAEPQLQKGYRSVALLNRMWIEDKTKNGEEVRRLRSEHEDLELDDADRCVINAVKACAFQRYGPTFADTAGTLFEAALKQFPNNIGFLFGAALMYRRKLNTEGIRGLTYDQMDETARYWMDKDEQYLRRILEVNDEYQLAKSYLGLNLVRRPSDKEEGLQYLEEAYEKRLDVLKVGQNLAQHYRDIQRFEKSEEVLQRNIDQRPRCFKSWYQLGLSYIRRGKRTDGDEKKKWNEEALKCIESCLKIKWHAHAGRNKARVLEHLGRIDDAKTWYEDMLLRSEQLTDENKLTLFQHYAGFLERHDPTSESRWSMLHRIMSIASSFEYQDSKSGDWRVKVNAKRQTEDCLTHGNLNESTDQRIPHYLAQTDLKRCLQMNVQARNQNSLQEASRCFAKAMENVLSPRANIALATAHNQLRINRGSDEEEHGIPLEADCIKAYREAIRCGSLVACLEMLRLIDLSHIRVTSRWKFLQSLAEIDVCCSQKSLNYLHRDFKPLSFSGGINFQDRDDDSTAVNAASIKQDVKRILCQKSFFKRAWKKHFTMERLILQESYENGDLTLTGRDMDNPCDLSDDVIDAAVDSCEKQRPLLDYMYRNFLKKVLEIQEDKMIQVYFPLIRRETENSNNSSGGSTSNDIKDKTKNRLKKEFRKVFRVNIEKCYPKLFAQLLEMQPAYNSQNVYIQNLWDVVNTVKHCGSGLDLIKAIDKDPVQLARRCTNKVEEICQFFKDAMTLKDRQHKLLAEIQHGRHEKADELLELLGDSSYFSETWKLLEMLAWILCSKRESSTTDVDKVMSMARGNLELFKKLRQHLLQVELAKIRTKSSTSPEVLQHCKDTCEEVDIVLASSLTPLMKQEATKSTTQNPQEASSPKSFPFKDLHPGEEILKKNGREHWKGKVKRELKNMGIRGDKKLLEIILEAQPCSADSNYRFLAMRKFLRSSAGETSSNDGVIKIQKANKENKEFQVLELTRWCADKVEQIATDLDNLRTPVTS